MQHILVFKVAFSCRLLGVLGVLGPLGVNRRGSFLQGSPRAPAKC